MSRAYSRGTPVLRSFRLILVSTLFLSCGASAAELPDAELIDHIEDRVDSGFYVGVIVGVIDGDKTTVQRFGETRKGSGVAPDEHTLFEISSVSKVFLATALAYLTVSDSVELTGLANDYLPADAQFGTGNGDNIRLVDLATHFSGLPYAPPGYAAGEAPNAFAGFAIGDLKQSIRTFEAQRAPGEDYGYSAFGYATLNLALASTIGEENPRAVIQDFALTPMMIEDTVFELRPEQRERLATGYTPDGEIATALDQGALFAAGSMYSTLHDLMVFLRIYLDPPDNRLGKAAGIAARLYSPDELVGLAWHRSKDHHDRSQFGTSNGYRAFVGFLEGGGRGVVVLANTKEGVVEIGERLLLGPENVDLEGKN
jgi:D-alanyl-D-alanine-carboxypeptidase/D-alanyl-D-alanine-endopeptidase